MVLNKILCHSSVPLLVGPFSVLVNHTRLLDFDIKRKYFRQELEQFDDGIMRDDLVLHLRRDHVFEDSFRELYRRTSEELKANFYIHFQGEEGQDAGGLLREWYLIIAREMFNPNYVLFKTIAGDRATYMPNPSFHINPITWTTSSLLAGSLPRPYTTTSSWTVTSCGRSTSTSWVSLCTTQTWRQRTTPSTRGWCTYRSTT